MSGGRMAAVVLGALVLQVCLLARFSYDGARPDVMVLIAIVAGYLAGPERGAQVGFAAGLAFDVVLATPFGLSALVYTIVGFAVASSTRGLVRVGWWIGPVVVAAASVVAVLLYAVVAQIVGQRGFDGPPIASIAVVVTLVNVVLSPLALRAVRWTLVGTVGRTRPFASR